MIRVLGGDCRAVLTTLPPDCLDACVTDPPYELAFMGRRWDSTGVAFDPGTWRTVYRVLKPGAFMAAFGGTRTYHRMVCAIEDAGFEIRDTLCWLYGSGFPKSHDVGKAIDKAAGAVREVVGVGVTRSSGMRGGSYIGGDDEPETRTITAPATPEAAQWQGWGTALKPAHEPIVLARKPLSERTVAANVLAHGVGGLNIDACRVEHAGEAGSWGSGSRPGGFGNVGADKGGAAPCGEYNAGGRWPANVLHDGSAEVMDAFAAFGERTSGKLLPTHNAKESSNGSMSGKNYAGRVKSEFGGDTGTAARFFFQAKQDCRCGLCDTLLPASDASLSKCTVDNAEVSSLMLLAGGGGSVPPHAPDDLSPEPGGNSHLSTRPATSAARSSTQCHPPTPDIARQHADHWPLPKIVQSVRSAATLCGSCATAIAQSLARARCSQDSRLAPTAASITEPRRQILNHSLALYVAGRESTDTILTTESLSLWFGSVFYAIAESTRQVKAGNLANIEPDRTRFRYSSKASAADRAGSKHPTVKPIALMRWLTRLVTPPGGHVLDPFAGSGTTGEAAMLEGFDCTMIEQDAAYRDDIAARMAAWPGRDGPLFATVAAE